MIWLFFVGLGLGYLVRESPRVAVLVVLVAGVLIATGVADRCVPVLRQWGHRP